MFTSIRTRLWWSYVLVTACALAVVGLVLLIYLIQNPSTYRQAYARLTVVATLVRQNEAALDNSSALNLLPVLEKADSGYNARIILYNTKRQVIADSRPSEAGSIRMPLLPRLRPTSVLRDQNGQPWLYTIQPLPSGRWLLVAVPRPKVPLKTIFSDELVVPILGAAIAALIVSLPAAFWLARWIGNPLQRLAASARAMPSAEIKPVAPRGPREVQELARSFNEMHTRVNAAQDSQRAFVANVSHELKTPLTSIQGFAQAILDGTADNPERRQQAARVIYDEAGRMHRMVVDLLELARLDAGTLELQYSPVDLAALLRNVEERFSPQAQAAGVNISVETAPLPPVWGDGDKLAQVFTNLLDNALKNTPSGGKIMVRANQDAEEVQVDVTDTGSGVPAEALEHIFERFYQADPSRPGGEKHGSGLGLAIVKEIVAAHGGKISVRTQQQADPNGPGISGSIFSVRLPLKMPETNPAIAKRKSNEA